MKMRLMYGFLWMVLLSIEVHIVTAKLWEMKPKETESTQEKDVTNEEGMKIKPKLASCSKSSNYHETVLKQFVGKVLNQFQPLRIPGNSDEKLEYNVKTKLSSSDLNKLSSYLSENGGDIYEVEEILTTMLGEVSSDEQLLSNLPMTFYEKYFSHIIIGAIIICVALLIFSLSFMKLSTWILIKWSVFLVFIVSILWNWYFLYKENVTKYQTAIEKGPPAKCNENYKVGFFESLSSSFFEVFHVPVDECEEYHQIVSISPALRVPPTEAISFCIVNTLLKPLASLGENIGLFFQQLSRHIPFHLQIVAVIFVLIIVLFLIIIFNGYSIVTLFLTLKPATPQMTFPELKDSEEIKGNQKKIINLLDNILHNEDMKEIRELLVKVVKSDLEKRQQLTALENSNGSGDAQT